MPHFDVLVIGAGAAGLVAARDLSARGLSVAVLEARDRIGGRVHTIRPPGADLPVELGAEFVHGRPRETLTIADAAGLTLHELAGDSWVSVAGRPSRTEDDENGDNEESAGGEDDGMSAILRAIAAWRGEDRSFRTFLDERFPGARWAAARRRASGYVEGFDAAAPDRVSIRWLAQTDEALASIQGWRQYRLREGYDRLLVWLRDGLNSERTALSLNTVVREIRWSRGRVEVAAQSPSNAPLGLFTARAAVVTLPLGVLAAPADEEPGGVRFLPDLPEKRAAIEQLEMGQVVKVVLRFREAFWDTDAGPASPTSSSLPRLPRLSFLLSDDETMPTWWTSDPLPSPLLVGWAGGPRAVRLAHEPEAVIAARAMEALARVLGVARGALEAELEAQHLHNWSADPFTRGAYSFVRAGGLGAPRQLGEPVEGTLFFAGEATDARHTGTVHAALASGARAASAVIAQLGR